MLVLKSETIITPLGELELITDTQGQLRALEWADGELGRVAAQGYAVDNQEIIPGGVCVAAPIVDKANKTVAAVSVTLAAAKAEGAMMPVLVAKVRAAADHVSMRLGKL